MWRSCAVRGCLLCAVAGYLSGSLAPPYQPLMRLVGVPVLLLLLSTWLELVLAFGFVMVVHFVLMWRSSFLLEMLDGVLFVEILVEAAVTSWLAQFDCPACECADLDGHARARAITTSFVVDATNKKE